MFRRRFVSGSLFVSPCPPECNFQSETKIEPALRLVGDCHCYLSCHNYNVILSILPCVLGS